jgi:transitional endoplasmic reticulum ATPase
MSGRDIRNLAAATKSLAHPNPPTAEHLSEAAGAARKRGNVQVGHAATWESLALEPAELERLKLVSALLRDAEKWRAQGIGVPNSLLLTGPDGGIKRQLAQTLSHESGLTFLAPTLSDFKANYSGQSGNRVKLFFERARSCAPAIVFLDRLDIIAPSRSVANATDALSNEIIGQLAQECERAQYSDGHVFLLGATSNLDQVDSEVLDCFQERMAVALPNRDARIKLFTRLLTDKKIDFSLNEGALLLADLTEGKSIGSRDIENSVQAAQQRALARAVRNGGPEHYSISLEDFELLELTRKLQREIDPRKQASNQKPVPTEHSINERAQRVEKVLKCTRSGSAVKSRSFSKLRRVLPHYQASRCSNLFRNRWPSDDIRFRKGNLSSSRGGDADFGIDVVLKERKFFLP